MGKTTSSTYFEFMLTAFRCNHNPTSHSEMCFFLMNIPKQTRESSDCVRILSVAPLHIKFKHLFERSDLIEDATKGFTKLSASGSTVRVFLDFIGFVGDTAESQDAVDCRGHTGNAFCTYCTVRRKNVTDRRPHYLESTLIKLYTGRRRSYRKTKAV